MIENLDISKLENSYISKFGNLKMANVLKLRYFEIWKLGNLGNWKRYGSKLFNFLNNDLVDNEISINDK